jgi:hypothetical protein
MTRTGTTTKEPRTGNARGFRALHIAFLSLLATSLYAAPDTILLYGPDGSTNRADVVFGWVGVPDDPTMPLRGYRYTLDGGTPTFTQSDSVAFYGLTLGEHRFRVAAVNSRLEEDATPIERVFTVTGAFAEERERNDLTDTASDLPDGTETRGISGGFADVDVFKIPLLGDVGQATLTFRRPTGGLGRTTIEIYRNDPALNDLRATLAATPENGQRVAVTFGTTAAVHYVRVQADANEAIASQYVLTVTGATLPPEHSRETEPNGDATSPNTTALSNGAPTLRLFGASNGVADVDWFRVRVDVAATRLLRMTLFRPGAGGETTLDAFAGTPPTNERQIVALKANAGNDQFVTFETGVTLGELWLKVNHANAAGDASYLVTLALSEPTAGELVEVEPNGTSPLVNPRSPNTLPLDTTLIGTSWGADVDWFRLDAPRPGTLTLSFERPSGVGSTRVRLFNANQAPLGETTANAGNGQKVSLAIPASAGSFYVELNASDESPNATYRLRATLQGLGILDATHSATRPLRRGETLRVTVTAPAGGQATFRLGDARVGIPLFDDGTHDDGAANDGVFAGTYVVGTTDELRDASVVVSLRDNAGSLSTRTLQPTVTLDGVPPTPITGVTGSDRPNDDGFWVTLRWNPSNAADLTEYRVYLASGSVASVTGRTPILTTRLTALELPVDRNNEDVFFAVTATDVAGNESALGATSATGGVRALDNRRPEPVTGARVDDTPDDFGGQVTVTWQASLVSDFAEYRLYVDATPIQSLMNRVPAARVSNPLTTSTDIEGFADGSTVFVAVTVLDRSGNESPLGSGSVAGPATPVQNVSPDDSPLRLMGPVGVVRAPSATFFWNRFRPDGSVLADRYAVELDGRSSQWVGSTSATYTDIPAGRHTIRVSVPGTTIAATQTFVVEPGFVPETEPNDSDATATPATTNRAYQGVAGADSDIYRLDSRSGAIFSLTATAFDGETNFRLYRDFVSDETLATAFSVNAATRTITTSTGTHDGSLLLVVVGTGHYVWSAQSLPLSSEQVFELEPNASASRATMIALDDSPRVLRGVSGVDGDRDAFAMPVTAAGDLTLTAYRPTGSGKTTIRVARRDSPVSSLELDGGTVSKTLSLRVAPDAYVLTVETERASSAEYHVRVAYEPPKGSVELEPNDRTTDANPLTTETVVTGNSWKPDDVDRYRVVTDKRGTLVVEFSRPGGVGTTTLRLLNAAGTTLGSATAEPANGGQAHLQADVPAGVYIASVEPVGEGDVAYHLTAFGVVSLNHSATDVIAVGDAVTGRVVWRTGGSVTLRLTDAVGNVVRQDIPTDATADGVYTGTFTVSDEDASDSLTLAATLRFGNAAATVVFPNPIRLDVSPPAISSASHDARAPLKAGDILRVTASATKGLAGTFDIMRGDGTALRANEPLFDDGTLGDVTADDGTYTGRYVVLTGDDVRNATVVVRFRKAGGSSATRTIPTPVTFDTTPPSSVTGVRAEDVPNDEGGHLHVRWNAALGVDFARYLLYSERSPIVSVSDLKPVSLDLLNASTTEVILTAPDETPVYVAVVAVDRAGNVSTLATGVEGSVSGPVRARDNLAPQAVRGVRAVDRPNDAGGTLTVTWEPSFAPDFAEYRIYLSPTPLGDAFPNGAAPLVRLSVASVTVVDAPTPADGVPIHVAVTAVDSSGNESALRSDSVAGPVASVADRPPSDAGLPILAGPVASVRYPSVFVRWARFAGDVAIASYRVRVDGVAQITRATELLLSNLRVGGHRFSVEPLDGSLPASERVFRVDPLLLPESEPNDVAASASPLPLGIGVEGALERSGDADWYRVSIPASGAVTPMLSRLDDGETTATLHLPFGSSDAGRLAQLVADGTARPDAAAAVPVSPGELLVQVTGEPGRYRLALAYGVVPNGVIFETEPNDNVSAATPTSDDASEVVATLASDSDSDWFRFDFASTATFEAVFFPTVDAALYLGGSGTPVARATSTAPDAVSTLRAGVRPGAYFLKVTGPGDTTYAFRPRLTTTLPSELRELEPNGSPVQATRVTSGVDAVTGALDAGDTDWFRLELPVGTARTVRWTATAPVGATGSIRLFIEALGAPTTQIGASAFDGAGRATLSFPTSGGVYFVEVGDNSGTAFDYVAVLSSEPVTSALDVEFEPNDTTPNASTLRVGTPVAGSLWRDADVDTYRLEIEPSTWGYLLVSVEGTGVAGEVLDATQTPVGAFAAPSVEPSVSVAVPATGRLFFVRLRGASGVYRLGAILVTRAEHDARVPLGVGSRFSVTAAMTSGWAVEAEIAVSGVRLALTESSAGIYTGSYVVQTGDNATDATLTLRIVTPNGIVARLPLAPTLTLDTTPPVIRDVTHNAVKPLKSEDLLSVVARSEPGATATFEITGVDFLALGELYDDGNHNDGAANDGSYGGSYRVGSRDNVTDGVLRVRFTDEVGNPSTREATRRIVFDTTPPFVASVRHDGTRVLKTGDVLMVRLTGEPRATGDFSLSGVRENVPLFDNGTQGDAVAGDGEYVGTVLIREGDHATNAILTARLTDLAGNATTVSAPLPVGVDTTPPNIASVTHNATRSLRKGEILTVQLQGEPNGIAFFDIGAERLDIPLFDDGSGDDTTANDGVYTGSYVVAENDDITEALILARLADPNGNVQRRAAAKRVTLDAIPPEPITGVAVEDVPNDEGNRLRVTWNPSTDIRQFHRYQIYRQTSPIRSVKGLLPVTTTLVEAERTSVVVDVPANDVDYYFAVTALDTALNESALAVDGFSTAGPARATDDIAPASVSGVAAEDAPNDDGKALLVTWQSENDERDFGGYAVYVASARLADSELTTRTPATVFTDRTVKRGLVPTAQDGVDLYVAVVATDVNGNRSRLLVSSVAGPVRSEDNLPPSPVLGVNAIDAPGDDGGRIVVSWRLPKDATVTSFEVYRSSTPIRVIRASDKPVERVPRAAFVGDDPGSVEISTSSDESDTYVAVVAVDGGGNRSALVSDSIAGPVRSVANVIRAGIATIVRAGFDERASVSIPANAARTGTRVDVVRVGDAEQLRRIEEANAHLADANIDETVDAELRDTALWFQTGESLFPTPVRVTLGYPALDAPEIASDLRIFRLNTASRVSRWELVPGVQKVDTEGGFVASETRTLGVFRVARLLLPRRLDKVIVYPNPFSPESDRTLTFRNLTRDAHVDIFTLDARRVRTIIGDASGSSTWDGRNESGDFVASGLYLYLIRGANDHRTGQIFVKR